MSTSSIPHSPWSFHDPKLELHLSRQDPGIFSSPSHTFLSSPSGASSAIILAMDGDADQAGTQRQGVTGSASGAAPSLQVSPLASQLEGVASLGCGATKQADLARVVLRTSQPGTALQPGEIRHFGLSISLSMTGHHDTVMCMG